MFWDIIFFLKEVVVSDDMCVNYINLCDLQLMNIRSEELLIASWEEEEEKIREREREKKSSSSVVGLPSVFQSVVLTHIISPSSSNILEYRDKICIYYFNQFQKYFELIMNTYFIKIRYYKTHLKL